MILTGVIWCLQRASPPCSSLAFSRSCLPPFSLSPLVGSASVGSRSRRLDSSPSPRSVLRGRVLPASDALPPVRFLTGSALSGSFVGSIPRRLPLPRLAGAPAYPPTVRINCVFVCAIINFVFFLHFSFCDLLRSAPQIAEKKREID